MPEPKSSDKVIAEKKSSYRKWIESEGVPLVEGFFMEDINEVPLKHWARLNLHIVLAAWHSATRYRRRSNKAAPAGETCR